MNAFASTGLAGVVFVSLSAVQPWWVAAGLTFGFAGAASAAAIDARSGRIPDRLVLVAAVPTAVVLVGLAFGGDSRPIVDALIGLIVLALPLMVLHLISPTAMGFGDVKLAAVLGASIGLVDPRAAVLALLFASGMSLIVALALRRSTLPFGPGLVGGVALAVVIGSIEGLLPWR